MDKLELHGFEGCPFAWRTRIAAQEKRIPFDWIPVDAAQPDARVEHNPEKRSPMLVAGDVRLTESFVIAQYLDEAYSGPSLQPKDARARAEMRIAVTQIGPKLEHDARPTATLDDQARTKVMGGLDLLEKGLADGRHFLGGVAPSLADVQIWPFLGLLKARHRIEPGSERPRAKAYWERVQSRPSYSETRPAGVR